MIDGVVELQRGVDARATAPRATPALVTPRLDPSPRGLTMTGKPNDPWMRLEVGEIVLPLTV